MRTYRIDDMVTYPVKSCRGVRVLHGEMTPRGLAHDRVWMVVNRDGHYCSQRDESLLALVETRIHGGSLTLALTGYGECTLPLSGIPNGEARLVSIRDTQLEGIDQGSEVASWMSEVLGEDVRIVRMADAYMRRIPGSPLRDAQTAFADSRSILVTSRSSLDDLNARLVEQGGSPVPMDRFRPNLVIDGCAPYEEDTWRLIRIGSVRFRFEKWCARCVVVNTDQASGARGEEPLRMLARYRKIDGRVCFGAYYTPIEIDRPHPIDRGHSVTVIG